MKKSNSYQEKILKDKLKKEAIEKLLQIKQYIEEENQCAYGASIEQNLTIIIEDLDDILLNWER